MWRRERLINWDRHPEQLVCKQTPLAWGAPASGDAVASACGVFRVCSALERRPRFGQALSSGREHERAPFGRLAESNATSAGLPYGRWQRRIHGCLADANARTDGSRRPRSPRQRPFTESQALILQILLVSDVADTSLNASSCSTRPVDLRPSPSGTCLGVRACLSPIKSERADPAVSSRFQ